MVIFVFCFIGTFLGGMLVNVSIDLWSQWEDNKFRRTVGLQTKPVRIRRF